MRIPLVVDLKINAFSGVTITDYDSGITNGMVSKRSNGNLYVTQRPSIDMIEDASDTVASIRGRGAYYWATAGALYFVNNDTIYKGDYGTVIGTISAGVQRGEFVELNGVLIFVDSENSEAWTITTSGTLAKITDVDFPPNQTPPVSLAGGAAVLDGFLFVLGADGTIYNSNFEDASAWSALDFINAERDPDAGVHICKHHDNLVVFGPSSIEFFYIPASPPATGSPLFRREDVFYLNGCSLYESVWVDGDSIFYVGTDESGGASVYLIENFAHTKVSNDAIDSLLTTAVNYGSYAVTGAGFHAHGHRFYLLTFYVLDGTGNRTPSVTYVYDATSGLWGTWSSKLPGQIEFPAIQFAKRTSTTSRRAEGIMVNGDIVTIIDNIVPQDTTGALGGYVTSGYVTDGYLASTGQSGTPYELKIRVGQIDLGTNHWKVAGRARLVADLTAASQTAKLSWSDGRNDSFTSSDTFDLSYETIIDGMGQFQRRNYELSVTSTEPVRLEAIDMDVLMGVA